MLGPQEIQEKTKMNSRERSKRVTELDWFGHLAPLDTSLAGERLFLGGCDAHLSISKKESNVCYNKNTGSGKYCYVRNSARRFMMSPLSEGNHASPQAQPLWSMYRYNGSWIEQLAELTGIPSVSVQVEAEPSIHRRKFKSAQFVNAGQTRFPTRYQAGDRHVINN